MFGTMSGPRNEVIVAGGGAWGTTLSLVALRAGRNVTLLTRHKAEAEYMVLHHAHPRSLPGITLPPEMRITSSLQRAFASDAPAIIAIPTQALRGFVQETADRLADRVLVSAAKGLEIGSLMRPSQILADELGSGSPDRIAVLSGPNLATEIAMGKPAATVIASKNPEAARTVQRLLLSSSFRTYSGSDVIGVELGGALKNIIAIGAGIADGLEIGDNAKASFLTRGIAEISRLGVACGANPLTFSGLSGIGDLMATCASRYSRNYRAGLAIAGGEDIASILSASDEVVEGIPTTRAALALAARHHVELPIAAQVARVLFEGASPRDAIETLMTRQPTDEL